MREGAYPAVRALCEKGLAKFFDSAQDLHRLLLEDQAKEAPEINFWNADALENMKREIDVIMKRHHS